MATQIRPLEPRDIGPTVALWQAAGLVVPHNDPLEDILFCRDSGHGTVLLGFDGDSLVASVLVGHEGHRGWMYYVAVAPEARRKGWGRRIVAEAEAWLRAKGVPKVQLLIRPTNAPVRDFYARLGYVEEERLVMSKRFAEHHFEGPLTLRSTVTHLQMLERPTRPTVPPPAGLRLALIRAERPSVSYYRYLYDTVGSGWTWIERRLLSDEALTDILGSPGVEVYVLHVGGVPAGFGELDRRDAENVELAYFGLLPEFVGRGIGWYLLNAVVDIAWTTEPSRVWVHTCDLDHPRALGNYQRAGFVPFDQTIDELPDPRTVGLPWPTRRTTDAAGGIYLAASGDHSVVPIVPKHP
jgi:GNAT superfamily N-acetyltransferase